MLTKMALQGALDACNAFGVDPAKLAAVQPSFLSSLIPKAREFGQNQMGAARSLFNNVRGGFGGKMNPELISGAVPEGSMELARGSHRAMALQNMKTLAPSLAAAGGLGYMALRDSPEEKRRKQMMAQGRY